MEKMVYSFIAYLKFLLSSTNHHGVHSPFIYRFVTQCLYQKHSLPLSKIEKVLIKSIHYFNFQTVYIVSSTKRVQQCIEHYCPTVQLNNDLNTLTYVSIEDYPFTSFDLNKIPNDAVLIVSDIHKHQHNNTKWEVLKKQKKVTVTIDLFYCGVVFFRKEQEKEHFTIRF